MRPRTAHQLAIGLLCTLLAACGEEASAPPSTTGQTVNRTVSDPRIAQILTVRGDAGAGEQLYLSECESCHLEDGTGRAGGGAGKDLTDWLPRHPDEAAIDAIVYGRTGMLAYGTYLSDEAIADLIAHMRARFAP